MEVVKEPLAQWEFDILKQLAIEKPNNVGLTGGQFLEILSRLEQAEQAVARVRDALSNHPRTCDRHTEDDPVKCGWKRAVIDVQRALEGDTSADV